MKIKIEVGEPRGFDANGSKVITGTLVEELCGSRVVEKDPSVAAVVQAPRGEAKMEQTTEYWFVVNFENFVVSGDIRFKSLLATPRYRVKKAPVDFFNAGEDLVVNAIWRKDAGLWDEKSIAAAQEGEIDVEGLMVARASLVKEE